MALKDVSFHKNSFGKDSCTATVSASSTATLSDKIIHGQTMCVITVTNPPFGAEEFPLHFLKHEIGRPQLRQAAQADLQKILQIIALLAEGDRK